ncbi:reverse transcriptase domain-containing protein [Tanacetum coccineum]
MKSHHGFLELHQLDTFYNALNSNDQDSLNSAEGGNFLDKMSRDCLRIIESKSKVHMVKALLLDKKNQTQAPAPVKAVEESCVTCGGTHSYRNCPATDGNVYHDNIQEYASQATAANFNQGNTGSGTLPSNTITNPMVDLKGITTRSGVAYQGPTIPTTSSSPPKVVERETEVTKDTVPPTNSESTKDVQPPVVQVQPQVPNSEPVVAPVSASMPNLKPSILYPSRRNDERRREKANEQIEKFYEIFKDLSFEISLTDALILMPKFASTLKALIGNKEKLRMDECLAFADLGSSINLMPLSVWKKLSLPELTPTCITLELADHSITQPIGIAKDVDVKVGKFQFPADFVVVDFEADPRVPLTLGRSFLKTGRALINVYEGELTLRVGKEAVTFNLDQTSRYSSIYDDNSVNRIDVIEMACEEYSQEVLSFSNVIASGNPTPYFDPIVSTSSLTLTPFKDSDFLLVEVDAFLALEDDPTSPEVDDSYYDPEGDILLLEAFLNDDPKLPLVLQRQNQEPLPGDILGVTTLRDTSIYYPKRYWEILPKEILGDTTQRDISIYYPKIYWEILPKEILGVTTRRDIKEILGDTTQIDIEEILGDTTQIDIKEILGDTTQIDIEEILGDTTQRDTSMYLGNNIL